MRIEWDFLLSIILWIWWLFFIKFFGLVLVHIGEPQCFPCEALTKFLTLGEFFFEPTYTRLGCSGYHDCNVRTCLRWWRIELSVWDQGLSHTSQVIELGNNFESSADSVASLRSSATWVMTWLSVQLWALFSVLLHLFQPWLCLIQAPFPLSPTTSQFHYGHSCIIFFSQLKFCKGS